MFFPSFVLFLITLLVSDALLSQNLSLPVGERPAFLENGVRQYRPTQIFLGVDASDFAELDFRSRTFFLDATLRVAWRDDRFGPSSPGPYGCSDNHVLTDFSELVISTCPGFCVGLWCADVGSKGPPAWDPQLFIRNMPSTGVPLGNYQGFFSKGAPEWAHQDPASEMAQGTWLVMQVRILSPLSQIYDLRAFPYDRQRLFLEIYPPQRGIDRIAFVPIAVNSAQYYEAAVPTGYTLHPQSISMYTRNITLAYRTYSGATEMSIFGFEAYVDRDASPYLYRYIFPAFLVVLMALAANAIPNDRDFFNRIGSTFTAFTVSLFLEFTLASQLAYTDELTRVNKFFILCDVIFFINAFINAMLLLKVAYTKNEAVREVQSEKEVLATRISPSSDEHPKKKATTSATSLLLSFSEVFGDVRFSMGLSVVEAALFSLFAGLILKGNI